MNITFKTILPMFNLLKSGLEYNKLADALNEMNHIILTITPKIKSSVDPQKEFSNEIIYLTYIAIKKVIEKIEKYGWPFTGKIIVYSIKKEQIRLGDAIEETIGKLHLLANELNMGDFVKELMQRGELFKRFESKINSSRK